jgi:hypothetical protein
MGSMLPYMLMGSMLPYMAYMDPMVIGYTTNDDLVISKMFPRRSSTLGRSTSTELRSVKRGPEGQRFENRHTVHIAEVPDLMDCHGGSSLEPGTGEYAGPAQGEDDGSWGQLWKK